MHVTAKEVALCTLYFVHAASCIEPYVGWCLIRRYCCVSLTFVVKKTAYKVCIANVTAQLLYT